MIQLADNKGYPCFTWVFKAVLVKMTERASMKEITKLLGIWPVWGAKQKKLFNHLKGFRGQILTDETRWDSLGTPRKSGFSERKRPKEGERVVLGHFHERVI